MNKTILKITLCAAAATTLFSACSSESGLSQAEVQQKVDEAMKSDLDSPIALFAESNQTTESRSTIESSKDKYFQTTGKQSIGIMMVATAKIKTADGTNHGQNIDWSKADQEVIVDGQPVVDKWSVYLNNEAAGVQLLPYSASTTLDNATGSRLYWQERDNNPIYYPLGNAHKYSFYGYYPRADKKKITYKPNYIYVDFDAKDIDGRQDIIWGKAEPVAGIDEPYDLAYSAKFFRHEANRDADDQAIPPTMNFRHEMMMFTFQITAGGTPLDKDVKLQHYNAAYRTRVEQIAVTNVASTIRLWLAGTDGSHNAGDLDYKVNTTKRNMVLTDDDAGNFAKICPQPKSEKFPGSDEFIPDTINVGQGIILPALSDEDRAKDPYFISVTLQKLDEGGKPVGGPVSHLVPVKLETLEGFSKVSYQKGYKYNIILKIYSPEDIQAYVTLEPWKIGDNPFYTDEDGTIPIH